MCWWAKLQGEAGEWNKKAAKFVIPLFINFTLNAHTGFWSRAIQLLFTSQQITCDSPVPQFLRAMLQKLGVILHKYGACFIGKKVKTMNPTAEIHIVPSPPDRGRKAFAPWEGSWVPNLTFWNANTFIWSLKDKTMCSALQPGDVSTSQISPRFLKSKYAPLEWGKSLWSSHSFKLPSTAYFFNQVPGLSKICSKRSLTAETQKIFSLEPQKTRHRQENMEHQRPIWRTQLSWIQMAFFSFLLGSRGTTYTSCPWVLWNIYKCPYKSPPPIPSAGCGGFQTHEAK